jgi:hypothetical protein
MAGTTGHVPPSILHPISCKSDGYGSTFEGFSCLHIFLKTHYLDISRSGTMTVTSGIIFSFRMHPVLSGNIWIRYMFGHFLNLFAFQKVPVCHWFPCSGPPLVFSCPPWRPPRKISTDSPDFEFSYHNLMLFIYGQRFVSWTKDNSCLQLFLVKCCTWKGLCTIDILEIY